MDYDALFDTFEEKLPDTIKNCCDNNDNYILQKSIIICKSCNSTVSNIIDSPEWRFYGSDDSKNCDPTRCGMAVNLLLPDSSVGTNINRGSNKSGMYQVKQYQNWTSMTYKERSRYKIFKDIESICNKNNIPNIIITESKSLYKLVCETKISRGNNRKGIIAACVYFACKNCNVGRSSKEIAEMFNIKISVFTKGCKNFQNVLQLSKEKSRVDVSISISPFDFIDRFCNNLNMKITDIKTIKNLAKKIETLNIINDIRPDSFASGCILYYCIENDIDYNKTHISNCSKISEVTVNKSYKKILTFKDKLS